MNLNLAKVNNLDASNHRTNSTLYVDQNTPDNVMRGAHLTGSIQSLNERPIVNKQNMNKTSNQIYQKNQLSDAASQDETIMQAMNSK